MIATDWTRPAPTALALHVTAVAPVAATTATDGTEPTTDHSAVAERG